MCDETNGEGRDDVPREDESAGGEGVCVDVGLMIRVTDPKALKAYARSRYAASWFDEDWEPADLAQAVLEALVISNENPSPDDYGIEILDSQADVRGNPRPVSGSRG
jgi:hypothetical protein